jgi:gluconate 2-dehydrogenase gamma chain
MDKPKEVSHELPQNENGSNGTTPTNPDEIEVRPVLSRRDFLKAMGITAAGLTTLSAASCEVISPTRGHTAPYTVDRVPVHVQYPAVPYTPAVIPDTGILRFFTPHEARTVEAFTARLLPGTPDDPGAREAGVVFYIDSLMSNPDGFAEPVYRMPPFAAVDDRDEPRENPDQVVDGVIWVPATEIERYGYQSIYTPREVMRMGLAALDHFANEEYDDDFADLSEDEQDEIIEAMLGEEDDEEDEEQEEENGEQEEEDEEENGEEADIDDFFSPISAEAFFRAMLLYTNQGMFSDPLYGGNRGMAGWRLIGYPGAQRAYSPGEIQVEGIGLRREPWSMANLPPFNPGQPSSAAINPVTGTDEHGHDVPPMPDFHETFNPQNRQQEQFLGGTPAAPPSPNH